MPRAKSSPAEEGDLSSALAVFWTPPTKPRRSAASHTLSTTPTRKARNSSTTDIFADISTSQDLSIGSEASEYVPAEYTPRKKTIKHSTDCSTPVSVSPRENFRLSRTSAADQSSGGIGPLSLARKQIHSSSSSPRGNFRRSRDHSAGQFPSENRIPFTDSDMGPIKENVAKRKATEEPSTPSENKRIKSSHSEEPDVIRSLPKGKAEPIPFPEKPAVLEERNGEIEFRVVNNDNERESLIILTGLKCIFQKQLPKMPKDYIARLVYDRTHLSIAIVKKPLEVVGGITYRPFKGRKFAEIVFCAISSDQQVKGYGAHLMSHLKDYVKATSDVMHFLTYADNYAIGYFKKQGFTKEITLEKSIWMGYIKDYEGGTIMQCSMLPRVRYLEMGRMLLKQKEAVHAKIRAFSKSHQVHAPPKQWKNGVCKIDPLSIEAIRAAGWSPDMDELARQPRHGPNYNQLLHLLNDMQNHNSSWPFLNPVSRDDVADYYDVIKEPMDLSTMEAKLEADNYAIPEDFVRDAKLVFDNCRKYNNETTPYAKSANKLEKYMWQQIKAIPEWSHLEQ